MIFFKNHLIIACAAISIASLPNFLEAAWTTPVAISNSNSDHLDIAVDLSGNAVAVWQGFDGSNYIIQSSKLPYNSIWNGITTLSDTGQDAQSCEVSVDSSGNAVSVWSRFDGEYSIIQSATSAYGSSWSSPVNISVMGANAEAPELAMDYRGTVGNAVAVWHRYNGSNFIVQAAQLPSGGHWSAPDNISPSGQDALIPEISVDPNGNAVAICSRYDGTGFTARSISILNNQTWSASYLLSGTFHPSFNPHVTTDISGNTVAVWSESDGSNYLIQMSSLPYGQTWSALQTLSSSGLDAFAPIAQIDGSGNIIVVWIQFDGSNYVAQATVGTFGGSWSSPVTLSSTGQNVSNIQLAVNTAGQNVVVWDQTDGTNSMIYSTSYTAGGGWQTPSSISTGGNFAYGPVVGIDNSGHAVAIWLQFDGTANYLVYGATL